MFRALSERKHSASIFLCIATAFFLANPKFTQALPLVISAEADTHVRTDLSVRRNDNYGMTNSMLVGTSRGGGGSAFGGADAIRSLLRFDLTDSQITAKEVILELTINNFDFGKMYEIGVYRVLESWLEGNGCEGPNSSLNGCPVGSVGVDPAFGVAWHGGADPFNPQGAISGLNNQTQPAFDPNRITKATVDTSFVQLGDVLRLDITPLYNSWIAGFPNEGLLLRDVTSDGSFREIGFGTRDDLLFISGNASPNAPAARLVVFYVPLPATLALFVLGLTCLGWSRARSLYRAKHGAGSTTSS